MVHEWHAIKFTKCQIGVLLGSWESTESGDSKTLPEGHTEKWKELKPRGALCQGSKYARMGTTQFGKHMGISGGSGRWGRKASAEM
jgi:hypothetical protein